MTNIGFIGTGNMGQAIIKGIINQGYDSENIWAIDHNIDKLKHLQQKFNLNITQNIQDLIKSVSVLILAIKPQDVKNSLIEIAPLLKRDSHLIISIAAGIKTKQILSWITQELPIVRVMPNTPCMYKKGMTGLYADKSVNSTQKHIAETLFNSVGETLWVKDEGLIDTITAISGSGPAYFFYMLESIIEIGVELGLTEEESKKLAIYTGEGAITMALNSEQRLNELRYAVTSKGGTTQAGLNALKEHKFKLAIKSAIKNARIRSEELSNLNN